MLRRVPLIVLLLSALSGGCASSPGKDPKSPKTLLAWSVGPEEEEEPNGNGDDKKEADEPEEREPIVTDRPDFTEASSTVGRGVVQLESGYTYFSDRSNGQRSGLHSYPEALFRIGLFADWFELRIQPNYFSLKETSDGATQTTHGFSDLYLGTKLWLTEQKAYLPETALVLQAFVPTGKNEFSGNRVLPGANLLYGWDVIEDCITFAGSTQGNKVVDDDGHPFTLFAQSFSVGYTLTEKLGAYTEWFAFFPCGAIAADTVAEHYFDGGFTYKVTNDFQLDIRAGVGLNEHAVDYFVGTGFAVRR